MLISAMMCICRDKTIPSADGYPGIEDVDRFDQPLPARMLLSDDHIHLFKLE